MWKQGEKGAKAHNRDLPRFFQCLSFFFALLFSVVSCDWKALEMKFDFYVSFVLSFYVVVFLRTQWNEKKIQIYSKVEKPLN